MTDIFTPAKRSEVMSRIRSKGNKATEVALVKLFRKHHITGWRRHPDLAGKPDFVFRKARLLIFVDGCFWHGCRWHHRAPTSNVGFWRKKISANKERDRRTTALLRRLGWRVIRVWEHSLACPESTLAKVRAALDRTVEPPQLAAVSRRLKSSASSVPASFSSGSATSTPRVRT